MRRIFNLQQRLFRSSENSLYNETQKSTRFFNPRSRLMSNDSSSNHSLSLSNTPSKPSHWHAPIIYHLKQMKMSSVVLPRQRCFSTQNTFQDDGRHDEVISKLVQHYQNNNPATTNDNHGCRRANVILPCGYGKTNLAIRMLEEFYKGSLFDSSLTIPTAVYVTPTLELIYQTYQRIAKSGLIEENSILVVASSGGGPMSMCSTEPHTIHNYFFGNNSLSRRLLLTTYKSLPRIGESIQLHHSMDSIDFGIFDEAHHMEGNGTETQYGLHDANIPIDRRLFMTGTPRNPVQHNKSKPSDSSTGQNITVLSNSIGGDNEFNVEHHHENIVEDATLATMESEDSPQHHDLPVRNFKNLALFGPTIVEKSYRDSEQEKITVPIKLLVISHKEVCDMMQRQDIIVDKSRIRDKEYWLSFFLLCAFEIEPNIRHVLSFHSDNERANWFTHELTKSLEERGDIDDVWVKKVDGSMSSMARNRELKKAESIKKSVIANCRVFSTGKDWKWDLVYMADIPSKPYLIKQMIGRVSRPSENKERGYVLVPLLCCDLDEAHNTLVQEEISTDNSMQYERLEIVFGAMLQGNQELAEAVDTLFSKSTKVSVQSKIYQNARKLFNNSLRLPSDWPYGQQQDCIKCVTGKKPSNDWDVMLDLLKQYEEREHHCLVPMQHEERGKKLGMWLTRQRYLKKKSLLPIDRQQWLDTLGIEWDPLEEQWNRMFELLQKYSKQKGNCNVPKGHVIDDLNLGEWLHNQRTLKRKGKLLVERQQRLESLGMEWDPLEEQWNRMFELLQKYSKQKGNCNIPKGHVMDDLNLGIWLHAQRTLKRKGKLLVEREQRLDTLGIEWDPLEEQWNMMFELLQKYSKQKGNCNVPRGHVMDDLKLGNWLDNQRILKRKGKLLVERQQRLETLGIEWDPLEEQWNVMFELLQKYSKQKGNCNVPHGHVMDDLNLGKWLEKQRTLKRKGKLLVERQQRLDTLGIEWDPLEKQWNMMFELLQKYSKQKGNCNVPKGHLIDDLNLGMWLHAQRTLKRKGKLLVERQQRLETLGIEWDPLEEQWNMMFELLQKCSKQKGNCNVPHGHLIDDLKLGIWLHTQRTLKRKGKLLVERQQRLEALGIEWDPLEEQWNRMFELLQKYSKQKGNCNVPRGHVMDDLNLGNWLHTQRTLKRKGKLLVERQQRLETLGIEWNPNLKKLESTTLTYSVVKQSEKTDHTRLN